MGGRSMILYHGGTEAVMQPDCAKGRKNLDFGQGFYVTMIEEQAEGFARRKANDRRAEAIVSVYEFDYEKAIRDYRVLKFATYNEEWLDFVVNSRNGFRMWENYDLIEGGVANDRVIDTVELYNIGLLDKKAALGRLSEHQPNHQICILSQDLLNECLTFKEAIEL